MFPRTIPLFAGVIALCTTATAVPAGDVEAPRDLSGWGRVLDPSGDCDVSFDAERDRLRIHVPGTPHVLSAEDSKLPMNAPRVVRRVRGDFTAVVRVLGQLDPGRSKTTYYDPYHGAGLIVWQDSSNYLRLERAVGFINGRPHPYVNYELRANGRLAMSHGIATEDRSLFLKLRRQGKSFSAWYSRDGHRWVPLERVDTTLEERVEVGVAAVNASARKLSAELERFRMDDPMGSRARDYGDGDHSSKNSGAASSGSERGGALNSGGGAGPAAAHRGGSIR
jgi:regulation of enolase protein 1 (concanavalin A-like superfamily)